MSEVPVKTEFVKEQCAMYCDVDLLAAEYIAHNNLEFWQACRDVFTKVQNTTQFKFVQYYEDILHSVIEVLKNFPEFSPVRIKIAQAAPKIPGIELKENIHQSKTLGWIDIEGNRYSLGNLYFQWIELFLNKTLLGTSNKLDPIHLQFAILSSMYEKKKMHQFPLLKIVRNIKPDDLKQEYEFIYDEQGFIYFNAYSNQFMQTEKGLKNVILDLRKYASQILRTMPSHKYLKLLEQSFIKELKIYSHDQHKLGLGFPFRLLVGICIDIYSGEKNMPDELKCKLDYLSLCTLNAAKTNKKFKLDAQWIKQSIVGMDNEKDAQRVIDVLTSQQMIETISENSKLHVNPRHLLPSIRTSQQGNKTYCFLGTSFNAALKSKVKDPEQPSLIQSFFIRLNKEKINHVINKLLDSQKIVQKKSRTSGEKDLLYGLNTFIIPYTSKENKIKDQSAVDLKFNQLQPLWLKPLIYKIRSLEGFIMDEHWVSARLLPDVSLSWVSQIIKEMKNEEEEHSICFEENFEFIQQSNQANHQIFTKLEKEIHYCISSIFSFSKKDLETTVFLLKQSIEEIYDSEKEAGHSDEVFQISIQFYPATVSVNLEKPIN